jgi:hypothetical protein
MRVLKYSRIVCLSYGRLLNKNDGLTLVSVIVSIGSVCWVMLSYVDTSTFTMIPELLTIAVGILLSLVMSGTILWLLNISRGVFVRAKHSMTNPPGTILLAFVDFLFSPASVEQTFKPLIADWRYEYFEALKQNRKWKARWISIRYRCAFVWSMSLSKVLSLLKQLRSISK